MATSSRRTESNAGHGSQRVQNKAGKYTYKQHNKRGSYQQRPPPQQQGGPGWGLLYRPQLPRNTSITTPANSNPLLCRGSKAANEAREQRSKLLNKHLEPRDRPAVQPSRDATQEAADSAPPSTGTARHDPQHHVEFSTTAATETQESSTGAGNQQDTTATATNSTAAASSETQAQAEWASSQDDFYQQEVPPDIHFSTLGGGVTFIQLTQGCWEIQVGGQPSPSWSAGLPPLTTVELGQFGPLERAPPFTAGTIGRLAPMEGDDKWLLTILNIPDLDDFEPHTMLLVEGDQFMCELTPRGWGLRVHRLAPSPARASRQPTGPSQQATQTVESPQQQQPEVAEGAAESATPQDGTAATPTVGEAEPEEDEEDQDGDHRPPRVPISAYAEAEVAPLGEGRWRISVGLDRGNKPRQPGSLPTTVIEGDGGPVDEAPAIAIGTEGVLEFLTEDLWTLDIEATATTIIHEGDTMLLVPGDRLLLERENGEWHIRVELLSPDAPAAVGKLRQRRRNLVAAERRARKQKASSKGGNVPPTIPEHDGEQDTPEDHTLKPPSGETATPTASTDRQTAPTGTSASSSSSHEPPQQSQQGEAGNTQKPDPPQREHYNILSDGRQLRRSQRERQANQNASHASTPPTGPTQADTVRDGRHSGHDRHTQQQQPRSFYQPRTTTSTTLPFAEANTSDNTTTSTTVGGDTHSLVQSFWQLKSGANSNTHPVGETQVTQQLTPTTPNPTPPETETEAPATASTAIRAENHSAAVVTTRESGEPASSSSGRSRSWERVEQNLIAIRQIAERYDDSQSRAIVTAAETALIDLLVDTPTAIQLDASLDNPSTEGDSAKAKTSAAKQAAKQLGELARQLLGHGGDILVPYAMVAPHVSALIEWFGTLEQANIAVHVQLPPVLTPLRGVLNDILAEKPGGTAMWAKLIAVTDALENLIAGNTLTHPADVVAIDCGAGDSTLMHAEATPEWYLAVETLRSLLSQIRGWPPHVLPTVQAAAMNFVRGIAAATPEAVDSGDQAWQPEPWWYQERHHGLGDTARSSTSPRGPPQRRPRSPSVDEDGGESDQSHRRRRLMAEHFHGGD